MTLNIFYLIYFWESGEEYFLKIFLLDLYFNISLGKISVLRGFLIIYSNVLIIKGCIFLFYIIA
jgi:hypothetical protein